LSVFTLLSIFLLSSEPADTIEKLPIESFLETVRIIHHPEEIMFQGRVYDLELFVHFPKDSGICEPVYKNRHNQPIPGNPHEIEPGTLFCPV
jgi:hypothetical protein